MHQIVFKVLGERTNPNPCPFNSPSRSKKHTFKSTQNTVGTIEVWAGDKNFLMVII